MRHTAATGAVAKGTTIGSGDRRHQEASRPCPASARIMSAAFSAIMIVGALVFPEVISSRSSTTASG